MNTVVTHWGARARQQNMDVLAADPSRPQAFPAKRPVDWMGRIRVRICAEDGNLVAYGFGDQRIEMPTSSVGAVRMVDAYRTGVVNHGQALLVFDRNQRILLRAGGLWETYGEVARVCRALRLSAPDHVRNTVSGNYVNRPKTGSRGSGKGGWGAGQTKRRASRRHRPSYEKAPGYHRLRTKPLGHAIRVLVLAVLFALTLACGVSIGILPALLLPGWLGSVRVLIGVVGGVLGAACGLWAGAAISHIFTDALRWAAMSWAVGSPAPPGRFFRRGERWRGWAVFWKWGLIALVPALIGWGPGVGIVSLTHGVSDSRLVAELRADGVSTRGLLIDVPQSSTDSGGNTTVSDVPTLSYKAGSTAFQTVDPSIGGRPLPLDAAYPARTRKQVTVVYLRSDPGTAAAKQQITGSVWHGAPMANVISGSLLTLALPLPILGLLFLRRSRARKLFDIG